MMAPRGGAWHRVASVCGAFGPACFADYGGPRGARDGLNRAGLPGSPPLSIGRHPHFLSSSSCSCKIALANLALPFAELKIMSAVEAKEPGFFTKGVKEKTSDSEWVRAHARALVLATVDRPLFGVSMRNHSHCSIPDTR